MLRKAFFLSALLIPFASFADDVPLDKDGKPLAGHSTHGDAFDEGPRQAAVLMKGMGEVNFPITTQNAEAQKFFNQGVAQLHGFWYYEAERSFRQAAKLDPDAPMAYWGMAMANVNNTKRAAEFMKKAVSRIEKATPREQLYIRAYDAWFSGKNKTGDDDKVRRTALVKALEKIVFEFPDDIEAKAFLVLQVWGSKEKGVPLSSHTALASLAGEVLAKNPMHPGAHHYLIHLWNHEDDRRALPNAALNGQSAPGIAHLWHMPGHTFTALRRYADAAWQQEASARTDHAYMQEARLMPEQIHNYAHNNDWLVENLGFVGRVHDAIALAKNMIELPRLAPSYKRIGRGGYKEESGGYAMGRKRLTAALVAWELWDELLAMDGGPYLQPWEDATQEIRRIVVVGTAAFAKGDAGRGDRSIAQIRALLEKAKQEPGDKPPTKDPAGEKTENGESQDVKKEEPEEKPDDKPAPKAAEKPSEKPAAKPRKDGKPVKKNLGVYESAIAELEFAKALGKSEDTSEEHLKELRTLLAKVPGVGKLRLSRMNDLAGDIAKATQLARDAVKEGAGQVLPLANLTDILWRKGDKQEALDTFNKLRPLCAAADLDMPVLRRLRPVADELKLSADWRPKAEFPADSGKRPDLASLGPFRWQPYQAPGWTLTDQDGRERPFTEFKGKPVLLIFYLGSGCSHCIEQLNTFGPETKEYTEAGIQLVAVSTEKAEELFKTFALAKGGEGFPFPILADPTLATFKAFRAFDDFETMPLHGTFLIDGEGLVRWQDISFTPFTNAKWLLSESKRLLALPRPMRPPSS